MATLTIEISDSLAEKLTHYQGKLETILELGISQLSPSSSSLYAEIVRFLAAGPSPDEIIAARPSAEAQERIRLLLDRNRQGILTEDEAAELDQIQSLNHFMTLLKAQARQLTH